MSNTQSRLLVLVDVLNKIRGKSLSPVSSSASMAWGDAKVPEDKLAVTSKKIDNIPRGCLISTRFHESKRTSSIRIDGLDPIRDSLRVEPHLSVIIVISSIIGRI